MTAQPARPGQISGLIARAARLARAGLGNASPEKVTAYLTATASLPERSATERAAGRWTRHDTGTARQAAAAARTPAPAAAGTIPPED